MVSVLSCSDRFELQAQEELVQLGLDEVCTGRLGEIRRLTSAV